MMSYEDQVYIALQTYRYSVDTDENAPSPDRSQGTTITFQNYSSTGDMKFYFKGMTGDVVIMIKDNLASGTGLRGSEALLRLHQPGDNYGHTMYQGLSGKPFRNFNLNNGSDMQIGPLSPLRYCTPEGFIEITFGGGGTHFNQWADTFSGKIACIRPKYGAT